MAAARGPSSAPCRRPRPRRRADGCARRAVDRRPQRHPRARHGARAGRRPRRAGAVAMGRIAPQRRPAATARILAALAPYGARRRGSAAANAGERRRRCESAGIPVTGLAGARRGARAARRGDVYVHWSEWDGQSLAILEAIARDVVVVASDIPANREVLGTGPGAARRGAAIALARAVLQGPGAACRSTLNEQRRRAPALAASRMATEWLNLYNTARPAAGRTGCGRRSPPDLPAQLRSESHGPEGLLALAWKRRWIVLGGPDRHARHQRAGDPRAADRVRVDGDARAHARRQGGPGPRRVGQPLGAAQHVCGDREVERQPRARPASCSGTSSTAKSTPRRRAGAASCASPRAREPRRPAAAARPPPRRSQNSIADNKLMVATIVDPASPDDKPVQPRPPLLVRRRRHPRPVRRHPARARVRAAPAPYRHRGGRRRSTRSRRCSGASTASARSRAAPRR